MRLLAAGRAIAEMRDSVVSQWVVWLGDRTTGAHTIPRATVEREFRLLFDVMTEMVGPLRREVNAVWFHACEHYGRIASARGLAAGEVVEELTFFREMLIRNLAPVLVAMRARQGMAIMLRLNRVMCPARMASQMWIGRSVPVCWITKQMPSGRRICDTIEM